MSYNQPPPQPGPYGGGAPGASNPYGQEGAAGDPGYGYPQQGARQVPPRPGAAPVPPRPGYGRPGQMQPGSYGQPQPPGPYGERPNPYGGQQPHPYAQQPGYGHPQQGGPVPYGTQPGPYGQPPFPPPPGGGNGKGKAAALAGASVVLLGAIVVGAILLTGGESVGGGSDKAMKLVTPKTLDGGTYVLDKDTAALKKEGTSVQDGMPAGATSVLARYKRTDDPGGQSGLAFSGAYGKIGDPRRVQEDMFKGFEASSNATVQQKRREYLPNGSDGPSIECEVVKLSAVTRAVYVPVCTWAEKSDAAMVMDVNSEKTSLESVDVAAFAKVTAGIYEDTRKPA
jgi:hypothetical protein